MRETYQKILKPLASGRASAMVTCIPRNAGPLKKIVLEPESQNQDIPEQIRHCIQDGIPHVIEEENQQILVEPFYPKERLIILGGGHIALPLVQYTSSVGFSVTVADDRPTFANEGRFPQADRVICETFDDCFDRLNLTEYDYVVVITRGHRHDTLCLRKLLSLKETVYLGMIGSKRRVEGVKELLIEEGYDAERIERICTPIGLKIGAITPEEIAISITAELIRRKRLESNASRPVNRSEYDPEVLEAIAGQGPDTFSVVTVMSAKGSVPRGPGAKMIVYPDRSIAGSIGGGCSEAAVIWDAMSIIGTGGYKIMDIDLTGDVAESEGMVCGGIMKVLIEDFAENKSKEMTREEAWALLTEFNTDPFHLKHAQIVEGTMKYFARLLGYGAEEEFWGIVGLLHDLDFGMYPEQHCIKQEEIMRERGMDERIIHATVSHGYGITVDVKPEHQMEKILFATDELTGLIGAAALMRPSKSVSDLELKSVKKKYKTQSFAAGCSRAVIEQGAEMLGWDLDYLIEQTILAMRTCE
jgi:xanthine dehydrogenase accessory factor